MEVDEVRTLTSQRAGIGFLGTLLSGSGPSPPLRTRKQGWRWVGGVEAGMGQQRRNGSKKLQTQMKNTNTRAKYGPRGKPAPVIVKNLETQQVLEIHESGRIAKLPSPAEIKAARTKRGGWTAKTLAGWGVSWPPPRGWRRRLEEEWRVRNEQSGPPPIVQPKGTPGAMLRYYELESLSPLRYRLLPR